MWFRAVFFAVVLSGPAQAQLSPTGPPQNAPPADPAPKNPAVSEAEAREKLAASGYPTVHSLMRSSNGGWSGTGVLNGREFKVHLGPSGEVEPNG